MDRREYRITDRIRAIAAPAFVFFFALEILAVSYGFLEFDPFINPLLWFIGSVGASLFGYAWLTDQHRQSTAASASGKPISALNSGALLVLVAGLLFLGRHVLLAVQALPPDPAVSDIVPTLEHYVGRLLNGEKVYAPIAYENWTVLPNYLPLMWLPYVPAEWLHLDYRFFSYVLLAVAITVMTVSKMVRGGHRSWMFVPLLPMVLWMLIVYHDEIYLYAVEFTIAAFYLLLAWSLRSRSAWWAAGGLLACLLSRYSFTFWLPVYLLMVWMQFGRWHFLKISGVLAAGVLFIYGPFLLQAPESFSYGMEYYGKVVESLWQAYYWQQPGETPFHLDRGLSFSLWFYRFAPGGALQQLHWNQWAHLLLCLLTAVAIFRVFIRLRKKAWFRFPDFALCSLALYLAVFYGFLYAPFSYLFIVPLFVKIPILFAATNGRSLQQSQFTGEIGEVRAARDNADGLPAE